MSTPTTFTAPRGHAVDAHTVEARRPRRIDPRGARTGAAITSLVLVAALILNSPLLVAAQAAVFLSGVVLGPAATPYARFYARAIRPRLGPPAVLEDARPPRFAQGCGVAFLTVALIGQVAGSPVAFQLATGAALVAALLNAVFEFCLGCEVYVRLLTLRRRTRVTERPALEVTAG